MPAVRDAARGPIETIRDFVTGENFSIVACGTCKLGVTAPRVTDLARYYGPQYWGGRHGFTAEYCACRRVKMLSELAKLPPSSRVLDFGSGDGNFLRRTSREGWVSFGVEASFLPEEPGTGRLRGVQQPGRGPQPRPVRRDHHLARARAPARSRLDLRELEGMLTPGGVMVIGVPDADGVQARTLGADWMHLDVPRHLFHFGRTSLERLLPLASLSPFGWWNHEIRIRPHGLVAERARQGGHARGLLRRDDRSNAVRRAVDSRDGRRDRGVGRDPAPRAEMGEQHHRRGAPGRPALSASCARPIHAAYGERRL